MFWLNYRANLTTAPSGSVVVIPDNEELAALTPGILGTRLLCVYGGCNSEAFVRPSLYTIYLNALKTRLTARGLVPWGFMVEEEWYDRVNGPIMDWPCFAGLDIWARKALIRRRLGQFYGMVHTLWPTAKTIAVETKWNTSRAQGSSMWYPVPTANVDILGIDAYMRTYAWTLPPTPALTSSIGAAMQAKFATEVGTFVEGGTIGPYTLAGAASYGKPLLIIGQAFHDVDPAGMWSRIPTPSQLIWWYNLAVRVGAQGMGWFCVRSAPGISGLDAHPTHQSMITTLWKKNLATL